MSWTNENINLKWIYSNTMLYFHLFPFLESSKTCQKFHLIETLDKKTNLASSPSKQILVFNNFFPEHLHS